MALHKIPTQLQAVEVRYEWLSIEYCLQVNSDNIIATPKKKKKRF